MLSTIAPPSVQAACSGCVGAVPLHVLCHSCGGCALCTALGTGIAVPAAPIRSTVREEWTSEYHPRPVHVRASAGLVLWPLPSGHGDVDRMYSFMY